MRVSDMSSLTKEEQGLLFSYFDTVLVDFDRLVEIKKIKRPAQKKNKKPGNK